MQVPCKNSSTFFFKFGILFFNIFVIHFPPVTKQAVSKKVFLKADVSAMCLQLSLLSCHCSVIFLKSTVKFPAGPNFL